ncbi:MAG: InlB B-repeat-containing protein [Lachnospiraceae bacterium]|nr:InlB B-repeat-containing protein [Lachnospiraceae bacterium]
MVLYVANNSTFNMTGGTIENNEPSGSRAGQIPGVIYLHPDWGSNTAKLLGGTISGNQAVYGGAIYNASTGSNNKIIIGGDVVLNGNTGTGIDNTGTASSNIYLNTNQYVTFEDDNHLTEGANVGIYTKDTISDSQDVKIATGALKEDAAYIHSDLTENAGVVYCDGKKDWVWNGAEYVELAGEAHHTHEADTLWLSVEAAGKIPDAPTLGSDVTDIRLAHGYEANSGSLSVTATGAEGATLSYQWYSVNAKSKTGGTAIEGATESTYYIPVGKDAGIYYYYCVVSSSLEDSYYKSSKTSSVARVTVVDSNVLTVCEIPDQNYTGSQLKPKPVVKYFGHLLKEGTDYDLTYGTNIEKGTKTGTVTVVFKDRFSGEIERKFDIITAAYSGTLSVATPTGIVYGNAIGDAPTVSSTAGSLEGETVKIYYSTSPSGEGIEWDSTAKIDAGTYYVWAEVAATDIHDIATSAKTTFTVAKATPSAPTGVLANSYEDTYDVAVTIPSGDSYADYEYSTDGTNWKPLPALNKGKFTPEGLAAHTDYTLSLRKKADSNNNASVATTATLRTPTDKLISYNANGSTAGVKNTVVTESKVSAESAIKRAGYTFTEWNTASDGSGDSYEAGDEISVTNNTTLYAQWTPNSYTVKYNSNGGNGTMSDSQFTYGTAASLSTNTFTKSGYAFRGWAIGASGNVVYSDGQLVSNLTSANDGEVTLYAVWTNNSYSVNGVIKEEIDGTDDITIAAGVTVKIMRGNVEYDTVISDTNGKYTFTGVPAGIYNIVATRTVNGKTQKVTSMVEINSNMTMSDITIPTSNVNSSLELTGDNTPAVIVGGLEQIAKDESTSDSSVDVKMTVEKKEESDLTGDAKAEMEEIKEVVGTDDGGKELEYLDINMKKTVTKTVNSSSTTNTTAITQASRVVEIVIPFKTIGRKNIGIYRYHDGKAIAFKQRSSRFPSSAYEDGWYFVDTVNQMVDMYTDKFSTYAITFEENTGSGSNSDGGGSNSGGDASGGGGSSSDSGTVTVPVSGEKGSVSISGNVSGSKVTINAISDEELEKVFGADKNDGTVVIDVSGFGSSVTGINIPKKTMEAIEAASADRSSENVLSIKNTNGTLTFDAKSLLAIVDQASGSDILFNLDDIKEDELDSAQRSTVKDMDIVNTYDAYITCNGVRISDFKGGAVTVGIPFEAEKGRDIDNYTVYYVPDKGAAEKMTTTYKKKMLTFKVTHFSNYVIAYEGASTDTGLTANGKSKYQNGLTINKGFKVSQSGKKVSIKWSKVDGASGYDVYARYCGGKFSSTPVKTVTKKVTSVSITKLNGKKIDLTGKYKFYVVAYKKVDGKKQVLGKTIVAHIVGSKNTTYSNPKKVTVDKAKVTLKVGKTKKIKAKITLVNKKRKALSEAHAAKFRYASSNKKIATVSKKGTVTAKKSGTCYIWVYAINGYAKKVKITVK